MKHLKKFNESIDDLRQAHADAIHHAHLLTMNSKLRSVNDARKAISQIYTIQDEIQYHPGDFDTDFLVDLQEFLNMPDCDFAGNYFTSVKELEDLLEDHVDYISNCFYVAPYWTFKMESDLKSDPYSATLFIKVINDISESELVKIQEDSGADECNLYESISGNIYVRLWWD